MAHKTFPGLLAVMCSVALSIALIASAGEGTVGFTVVQVEDEPVRVDMQGHVPWDFDENTHVYGKVTYKWQTEISIEVPDASDTKQDPRTADVVAREAVALLGDQREPDGNDVARTRTAAALADARNQLGAHGAAHQTAQARATKYSVHVVSGALWEQHSPIWGTPLPRNDDTREPSGAGVLEANTVAVPVTLEVTGTQYLGRFKGEQNLEVAVAEKNPAGGSTVLQPSDTIWIDNLYRFKTQFGFGISDLGRDKFTRRPPGAGEAGAAYLAGYDGGQQVFSMFDVAIYPEERPAHRRGDRLFQQLCLVVGTGLEDPLKSFFAGVGYEVTPGANLVAGWVWGPTQRLAPGYDLDDAIAATGDLPTVDRNDTEFMLGVTFDVDIFPGLFGASK